MRSVMDFVARHKRAVLSAVVVLAVVLVLCDVAAAWEDYMYEVLQKGGAR